MVFWSSRGSHRKGGTLCIEAIRQVNIGRTEHGKFLNDREEISELVPRNLRFVLASVLLGAGVVLLVVAATIPPPCSLCSMGIWPRPFLYLVGALLVLSGGGSLAVLVLGRTPLKVSPVLR